MIKQYSRIQGQHVIGAGFLATLLGVLFNLSNSKTNNYVPALADLATSAYADPYGYNNSLANQLYPSPYVDPSGRLAAYNGSLNAGVGGLTLAGLSNTANGLVNALYQNNGYGNGSYLNSGSSFNGYANNSYANSSYPSSSYPNSSYADSAYATGYGNNTRANTNYDPRTNSTVSGYTNNLVSSAGNGLNYSNTYGQTGYTNNRLSGYASPNNGYATSGGYNNDPYQTSSYSNTTGANQAGFGYNYANRGQQIGGALRAYFSPGGGCTDAIVRELQQAQRVIYIQAYSFTSEPIATACVSALRRGVQVVVLLDKSQMSEQNSAAEYLAGSGVTTMIDSTHQIAHDKVILIDGRTIITGSFNFTYAAEHNNAENLLLIHDQPELYAAYENNFRHHYSHSSAYVGRSANRSTFGYR